MSGNQRKSKIERRSFPVTEIRTITDEKGLRHITGYAAVFNVLSENLGYFREKIDPGAFSETINSDDIRALKNHNSDYVLGRSTKGTLTLSEDQRGLKFDVIPPDAQWAHDYMVSIDRGDVDQASFQFETLADRWEAVDGGEVRTLMKVRLYDISPVTFPAYPDTEVGLRSLEEYRKKAAAPSNGDEGVADPLIGLGLMKKRLELKAKSIGGV